MEHNIIRAAQFRRLVGCTTMAKVVSRCADRNGPKCSTECKGRCIIVRKGVVITPAIMRKIWAAEDRRLIWSVRDDVHVW